MKRKTRNKMEFIPFWIIYALVLIGVLYSFSDIHAQGSSPTSAHKWKKSNNGDTLKYIDGTDTLKFIHDGSGGWTLRSPTQTTITGGTGTTSDLFFKATSGVGVAGSDIHFQVGSNGATEAMTIADDAHIGVKTITPGDNLAGGSISYSAGVTVFHIKSAANLAQLTIEGSLGAFTDYIDLGGAADDKILSFEIDVGVGKFRSYTDVYATRKDNILVMDMGTGNVGIGVSPPLSALDVVGNIAVTGTVDGVDVAAHALRHASGGADALLWQNLADATADGSIGFSGFEQTFVISHTNLGLTGIILDVNQVDDLDAIDSSYAIELQLTSESGDVGDIMKGLVITFENGVANTVLDAGIEIDNKELTASTMTDAIIIKSTGVSGGVVDAIDVSDANITNAINIGANPIVFSTGFLSATDLEILDDGTITLTSEVTGLLPDANTTDHTGDVTGGTALDIVQSVLEDGGSDELAITAGMMNIGTGASSSTFWRGDNTWATPSGGGGGALFEFDSTGSGGIAADSIVLKQTTDIDIRAVSVADRDTVYLDVVGLRTKAINSIPVAGDDGKLLGYFSTGDTLGWIIDASGVTLKVDTAGNGTNVVTVTNPVFQEGTGMTLTVDANGDTVKISRSPIGATVSDLFVSRALLEFNVSSEFIIDSGYASNADTFLQLPTWTEGTTYRDSSMVVHPAVLYSPRGFFGVDSIKYAMGYTPFAVSDNDEHPHMAYSSDGLVWDTTLGGNPIDNTPIYDTLSWSPGDGGVEPDFLSDPDIFFDFTGDTMWYFFRGNWTADSVRLFAAWTTDGYNFPDVDTSQDYKDTWDGTDTIIQIRSSVTQSDLIAPSIIVTDDVYYMFYVNGGAAQDSGWIARDSALHPAGPWNRIDSQLVIIDTGDGTRACPWHIEVIRYREILYMLIAGQTNCSGTGAATLLFMAWSNTNGQSWHKKVGPIMNKSKVSNKWDEDQIYRSSGFARQTGDGVMIDLFYSAKGSATNQWHTGRTTFMVDMAPDGVFVERTPAGVKNASWVPTNSTDTGIVFRYDGIGDNTKLTMKTEQKIFELFTGSNTGFTTDTDTLKLKFTGGSSPYLRFYIEPTFEDDSIIFDILSGIGDYSGGAGNFAFEDKVDFRYTTTFPDDDIDQSELDFGTTSGEINIEDILAVNDWSTVYWNATVPVSLDIGASGLVLKSNGPTSAPSWQTDVSGGTTAWDAIADPAGDGSVDFTSTAQTLVMSYTNSTKGLTFDLNVVDDADATDNVVALAIDIISANIDAGDSLIGLQIIFENGTGTAPMDVGISIDNKETFGNAIESGIRITSSGVNNGISHGIDVSDANLNNSLKIGANPIFYTGGSISTTDFDIIDDGQIDSTDIGIDQVNDLDINFGSGTDQVSIEDIPSGNDWSTVYWNATVPVTLDIGASGLVLKSNGPTSAPSWQTDATGGTTIWNDIGDAGANGSIGFGATEQVIVMSQTSGDVTAFILDVNQVDDGAATDDLIAFGLELISESGDPGDTYKGFVISYENGTANTILDAAIEIDNEETTASTMTDAIIIKSSGVNGGVVDAIDVSAANITNAINLGANPIAFSTGSLSATDLEILDDGTITLASEVATFTSADLSGRLSDETGTGVAVFGTTPTFTTNITSPLVIGGTATTSDLSLQTTSGVGIAGADMHFLVGNNGATEAITILNNGRVGVRTTAPGSNLAGGSASYGSNDLLHVKSATDYAIVTAEGQLGAFTDYIYLGGAADDKLLRFMVSGGTGKFYSLTDLFAVRTDNILVMDMGSGNVGIGEPTPVALFTVGLGDDFQVSSAGNVSTTGTVDWSGAVSLEIPNLTAPTTDAIGEIFQDIDDTSLELFDGTRSVQLSLHKTISLTVWDPELLTDTIPIFYCDSALYQGGITLLSVEAQTNVDGAYTLNFYEFSTADPPIRVGGGTIVSLGFAAGDQRDATNTFTDAGIARGGFVYMLAPSTDVDWLRVSIKFYINGND